MARLTLGDQVSIVSTGEKGTIVGESNGLYKACTDNTNAEKEGVYNNDNAALAT